MAKAQNSRTDFKQLNLTITGIRRDLAAFAARTSLWPADPEANIPKLPTGEAWRQLKLQRTCARRLVKLRELGWHKLGSFLTYRAALNCAPVGVSVNLPMTACKLPFCPKCWMRETESLFDAVRRLFIARLFPQETLYVYTAEHNTPPLPPSHLSCSPEGYRQAAAWYKTIRYRHCGCGYILRTPVFVSAENWAQQTRLLVISTDNDLQLPDCFDTGPPVPFDHPDQFLAEILGVFRAFPAELLEVDAERFEVINTWYPPGLRAPRHRENLGKLRHNRLDALTAPARNWVPNFSRVSAYRPRQSRKPST